MVLRMRREKKRSFLHIVQLPADFDSIAEESLAGEARETPGSDCKAEQNFELLKELAVEDKNVRAIAEEYDIECVKRLSRGKKRLCRAMK